jgi:hypothetical protein
MGEMAIGPTRFKGGARFIFEQKFPRQCFAFIMKSQSSLPISAAHHAVENFLYSPKWHQ